MVRVQITKDAFAAICASLHVSTRLASNIKRSADGGFLVWMTNGLRGQINAARKDGESLSETIVRLARLENGR